MTAELSTSGDDFSVNGGKITDVADGVDPTDAANVSQTGGFSGDAGDIPFTPTGTISATDVQAAIAEVASEAVAGAGMSATLFDAKGDLLTATAADTPAVLTVGANDTVLVADSGQAKGIKWAAVPGTAAFIPVSTIDAKGDLLAGTADDTVDNLTVGANGKILTAASGQTTGLLWDSGYLGGLELVYKYTVAGTDKASIDTGVDAAQAGTNNWASGDVLEVFIYARTDQAATTSVLTTTVNNDTTSVYDRTFVNNTNTTVTGGNSLGQGGWALGIAGGSASTGTFALLALWCANYTGTVGNKQFNELGGALGQSAATATITNQNFTWRPASPAAITRLKIIPATGGVLLKIGTQLLIYKRRNA